MNKCDGCIRKSIEDAKAAKSTDFIFNSRRLLFYWLISFEKEWYKGWNQEDTEEAMQAILELRNRLNLNQFRRFDPTFIVNDSMVSDRQAFCYSATINHIKSGQLSMAFHEFCDFIIDYHANDEQFTKYELQLLANMSSGLISLHDFR